MVYSLGFMALRIGISKANQTQQHSAVRLLEGSGAYNLLDLGFRVWGLGLV